MDFQEDLEQSLAVLARGGLILYPTDTIWGIGCDATNEAAVARIYELKQRGETKSMFVLVGEERDVLRYTAGVDLGLFAYLKTTVKPTTVIYGGAIGLARNLLGEDGIGGHADRTGCILPALGEAAKKAAGVDFGEYIGASGTRLVRGDRPGNHKRSGLRRTIPTGRCPQDGGIGGHQMGPGRSGESDPAVKAAFYLTFAADNMEIHCNDRELFVFKKVANAAAELGVPCYLVGGFVRDKLIGRPTKDADIVCVGDGIALAHKVAERFRPQPPVNFFKHFGTAQVKLEDMDLEFVGARKESYQADSRNPDVEPGTLEDDQLRRDFTINAMAVSLNTEDYGKLIDPFGGLRDIELQVIKTPREPGQTFSDDPLRMMRAVRFAAQLQYTIEEETLKGMTEHGERIVIISQERITDELNKIILSTRPSVGFEYLYRSGLLQRIFPQMVELAGAEYIDGKGHKDNFYHTLQVLDNASAHTSNLWLRWAAILHDIAKPATKRFEPGHGAGPSTGMRYWGGKWSPGSLRG